jgi:hypothetical protein
MYLFYLWLSDLLEFERYEGEFNEGLKDGEGRLFLFNGDMYVGSFLRVSDSFIWEMYYNFGWNIGE